MTERERLRQWVQESKSTVFLGGAGVSTASGIPDFRSAHGLYQQKKQGLSYEEMLSHGYFVRHTAEFYDFLRGVMLYPDAKPNGAHYALASWSGRASCGPSSPRTLTASTRWRAAGTCWSSTAARTGTPASPAGSGTT